MKEIGGYFGLDCFRGREYYGGLIELNSGRNALHYVLKAKGVRKLYIPSYLCDTVINMLLRNGHDFAYYNINPDFTPEFDGTLEADEYLYIVNYFGQLDDEMITKMKERYGRVILDNTHAFFQKPLPGIDTIYSCRKYFGVPDGAYLATDTELAEPLPQDISKDRMAHILGRFEGAASDYYQAYVESGGVFEEEGLKHMSRLTRNLLRALDYEGMLRIRNENYAFLFGELKDDNLLEPSVPAGPFAYPFYIENGIEVRKKLAQLKIYIPTLWPNVLQTAAEGSLDYRYAANILPLPCDQRYDVEDMKYMVGILKENALKVSGKN